MATMQQCFDRAVEGIRRQGRPAHNTFDCRYIIKDGDGERRCAIGHLIKDEHYSASLEGKWTQHPLVADAIEKSGMWPADCEDAQVFFEDLQAVHDGVSELSNFLAEFERHAAAFAKDWGLVYTPPGEQ